MATLRPAAVFMSWYSSWQRWPVLRPCMPSNLHSLHGVPRHFRVSVVWVGQARPPYDGATVDKILRVCFPPPHGQSGPQSLYVTTQSTGAGQAATLHGDVRAVGHGVPPRLAWRVMIGLCVLTPGPTSRPAWYASPAL